MPWIYECRQCDARSPAQHDHRDGADAEQERHRTDAHGGLAPAAGDGVRRVHADVRGEGFLPAGWGWALLVLLALMLSNCWGR
ncbi:hypothetical protein AB0J81_09210 [Streptomyces bobili]|uniref:hypothetical protein n=1 Tax=Streptomyces bobili TaxID=67280 RepID=UPI00341AC40C